MNQTTFSMIYNGSYAPGEKWVSKLRKKGIYAGISVGEMYAKDLTPGEFGRAIATAVFCGIQWPWMVCYKFENGKYKQL